MRFITPLSILFFSWSAYAGSGVFMCEVDGEMVFRDHACGATIVQKPEKTPKELREEALKKKELQSLKESNLVLNEKLEKLEKQRDDEVQYYQEKIKRYSSAERVVDEEGLFKKIKELKSIYKSQIMPLEKEIKQGEAKIKALELELESTLPE